MTKPIKPLEALAKLDLLEKVFQNLSKGKSIEQEMGNMLNKKEISQEQYNQYISLVTPNYQK